jgi:hypothetical protein
MNLLEILKNSVYQVLLEPPIYGSYILTPNQSTNRPDT